MFDDFDTEIQSDELIPSYFDMMDEDADTYDPDTLEEFGDLYDDRDEDEDEDDLPCIRDAFSGDDDEWG